MKHRISELYDTYADKLVEFSKTHGPKSWIIFLFIFAFIIATTSSGWTIEPQTLTKSIKVAQVDNCQLDNEVRGVWLTNVDSDVLFSRDNTTEAIANLAELNFNTLYPTVWNWGYTLYPSAVA